MSKQIPELGLESIELVLLSTSVSILKMWKKADSFSEMETHRRFISSAGKDAVSNLFDLVVLKMLSNEKLKMMRKLLDESEFYELGSDLEKRIEEILEHNPELKSTMMKMTDSDH